MKKSPTTYYKVATLVFVSILTQFTLPICQLFKRSLYNILTCLSQTMWRSLPFSLLEIKQSITNSYYFYISKQSQSGGSKVIMPLRAVPRPDTAAPDTVAEVIPASDLQLSAREQFQTWYSAGQKAPSPSLQTEYLRIALCVSVLSSHCLQNGQGLQ